MLLLNEILYEKVMERASNYQMIIFVHSRRDTARTANNIKDTNINCIGHAHAAINNNDHTHTHVNGLRRWQLSRNHQL